MNLLAYAVNKKLEGTDSRLLEYVAKGEDIPVSVLDESLRDLLEPLEDERSSLLVEDYSEMLKRYVPVQYTKHPESGVYEASGEISDLMLEALELVHGLDQDEVISELIEDSARRLTDDQSVDVSVGELSLEELESQMLEAGESMSEIKGMDDAAVDEFIDEAVESAVEESEDFAHDEPAEDFALDEEEEIAFDEPAEEDYDELAEDSYDQADDESYEEEVPSEEVYEELPEDSQEHVAEQEQTDDLAEEDQDIDEDQIMSESIRRVYNKLVADLKAYGLDEALGLSI